MTRWYLLFNVKSWSKTSWEALQQCWSG